jgi:hypothetical protein
MLYGFAELADWRAFQLFDETRTRMIFIEVGFDSETAVLRVLPTSVLRVATSPVGVLHGESTWSRGSVACC